MKHEPKTSLEKARTLENRLFEKIEELHQMQSEGKQNTHEYRVLFGVVGNLQIQYSQFLVS